MRAGLLLRSRAALASPRRETRSPGRTTVAEGTDFKRLIAEYRMLSTANVSDGLDRLGIAGCPHGIGPLWDACGKIVGPAATLKLVPVGEASESPVLGTLEAIKRGRPGDVLVIDQGGRTDVNSYGGVAGFTTRHFGLVGCVIDGVTRDIDEYKQLNLPVYGRGFIQQSIRNRCACAGYAIEVSLGGVPVRPGDLVMADENGVCVVPKERIAEALEFARLFKAIEDSVIEAVRGGMDPVAAHERVRYDMMTAAGFKP
jgi:regulator of RNase E activity RraA